MDELDIVPPEAIALVDEIKAIRRRGITQLPNLETPALQQAVRAAGQIDRNRNVEAWMVESLLRQAIPELTEQHALAGAISLGLEPGYRSDPPPKLRRLAADYLGVHRDRYRRHYEPLIFEQLAQIILRNIHEYRLRLASIRMNTRLPVDTRLAVEWLTRFEAMYQIWTPITGLGNDLTGYRSTLLEDDRPWDLPPNPDDPEDPGYTQEQQAAGYVTDALYHFARVLAAERRFVTANGGIWLLPDAQAEEDLAGAMHRIRLATPNNERDDSRLRTILAAVPNEELDPFLTALAADKIGNALHDEWQQWAATCECTWPLGERAGREMFPTHLNHPTISLQCDMHALVAACNDFCLILGDAWDQIADWIEISPPPPGWTRRPNRSTHSETTPCPGTCGT